MKKSFIFLATAFLLNASVAKSSSSPPLLDDSASFRIAKSVKLGYGEDSSGVTPSLNKKPKDVDFNVCSSDNHCLATQKCVNGKCVDLCTSTTCSGETPDCEAKDHSFTCKCTETSCGKGKECVDGKCEPCEEGTACNCEGNKVIDSSGKCVCPAGLSCSAGQYVSGDCSCKNCLKDDTGSDKCGCPGNTVPNGSGGCYCKTPLSCDAGYSFDASNTCECVPCTDNASCDKPCPEGTIPTADGCKAYACATDDNCAAGNRCENGGTENAECVPCGKNEQCRCPDGQLSDGTGKCLPVVCKTGLICSNTVTEQCCDAGMQCVNPDTVESYCAAGEPGTQGTCPDGYLIDDTGACVKPACKTNNDCRAGKYCKNPGKVNAECVPCVKGETCTCTGGMVADGNGGCMFGCEFSTASACQSGTPNCSNCALTGGCYVCSSCNTGYEISGGSCTAKTCPPGTSTYPICSMGQKTVNTSSYSGSQVCKQCVNCAAGEQCSCPNGKVADGNGGCKSTDPCADVTCEGGKVCSNGTCVCPSDKPYWVSGQCRECPSGKVFVLNQCVPDKTCAEYGEEQGEYWYSSFDGWHAGCPDDRPKPAPTGVIGSDGSCNKCVANVTIGGVTTPGGFTPQGNCAGNQLSCNFGGSSVCCPYSTKGCKEYENDCQVNAYGTLATTCRCMGTSMP